MKNENKKKNIDKILEQLSRKKRIIIMFIMIIISILGGTFAWFTYQSRKTALVLSIGDLNDSQVIITPYQIRDTMLPVNNYQSGVYSQITVNNNNSSKMEMRLYYKINNLSTELTQSGLKYTIVKSSSKNGQYTEVSTGNFNDYSSGDLEIDLYDVEISSNTTTYYRLYLWLDSATGNQSSLQNTELDIELNADIARSANPPELDSGMIPVTISNSGVVTTISEDDDNWYDYSKKEWANIVLVSSSSRNTYLNTTGVTVSSSDILGYYVWIPRFKYKIWTTSVSSVGNEKSIDIIFESKTTAKSNGTKIGDYLTHPAFTFGSQELSGIWVGKFETTGSNDSPSVLPNITSLRNQNVSTQFATSLKFAGGTLSNSNVIFNGSSAYGLTTGTDSHMMKNSEWGATAYLSHSKYGINSEVRLNNNSSYMTGCGAASVNESGTSSCEISYGGSSTYPQSTTGNITGIFDMSGGAWEYVMGSLAGNGLPRSGDNSSYNSGFIGLLSDNSVYTVGIDSPDSKYYNLYTDTSISSCTIDTCGGHALYETNGWYNDSYGMLSLTSPWFFRGGSYSHGSSAGIFYFTQAYGAAADGISFRSVLAQVQTQTLSISKGTGVNTIYYKVNGASNYTSSSSNVSLAVNVGTTYYYYGTANSNYKMTSCTSSNPCSGTVGSSNISKSLSATLNSYSLTISKDTGVNTIYYKVNGASSYTSSTSNVSVPVTSGTTYYYYGTASSGYTMSKCTSSSPCSATMGTSATSVSLTAKANMGSYLINNKSSISNLSDSLTGGLYRYQGTTTNVTNNYICFGTSTKSTCTGTPATYMYRIIGVDSSGNVKIIKNTALSSKYGWNSTAKSTLWSASTLYTGLNESYFLTNTSYVPSGWSSKIASMSWYEYTWSVGNANLAYLTGTDLYSFERNEHSSYTVSVGTFTGKVSLMKGSDFYLSLSDSQSCGTAGKCTNSWMWLPNSHPDIDTSNNQAEWTMDTYQYVSNSYYAYSVAIYSGSAMFTTNYGVYASTNLKYVRPVFYISSSVSKVGGTGTESDPYIIS